MMPVVCFLSPGEAAPAHRSAREASGIEGENTRLPSAIAIMPL
jgi:hypothetical protein